MRTIAKDPETILSLGHNPFYSFSPFSLDNGLHRGKIEFATSVNCAVSPFPHRKRKRIEE